jgi:anti-sigma B factor antagonist
MELPTTEREGGIVVVRLTGAILGGAEAGALNRELHRLIDAGSLRIVVDLAGVTHMNSSGLGMLIGGYTTMRNNGGELRLACMNERLRALIEITKLHTVLTAHASVDEAVAAFSA